VWYLAYGSNLNLDRLRLYLEGGQTEPGARDAALPVADRWIQGSFRLYFALESQRWNGGGVAFVEPSPDHRAWFRAWNLSVEQFEDVFAQENRAPVGSQLPWDEGAALASGDHLDIGDSRYRRLIKLGGEAGAPELTFTSPETLAPNAPDASYRKMIVTGLEHNDELDAVGIEAYLERNGGVSRS